MSRIVALGDSTTHCVGKSGVTEATAWPTLLAVGLSERLGRPVEVINAGVDADTAPLALARLDRDALRAPAGLGRRDAGDERRRLLPPAERRGRHAAGAARRVRVGLARNGSARSRPGTGIVLCTSVPMGASYGLAHLPAYRENGLNYLVARYAEVTRTLARQLGLPLGDV